MKRATIALLGIAGLALAGCGTTSFDRATSGAGLGAAAGAIVGAVTPLGPGIGALVGAGLGGTTGAATSPSQVNLGQPVWKR
jgi:hypothetical protein